VVHIHFGMSGAFRTMPLAAEAARPPRETTRLRLEHAGAGLVAHLSAMTVAHGGLELYAEKVGGWGVWGVWGVSGVSGVDGELLSAAAARGAQRGPSKPRRGSPPARNRRQSDGRARPR
jgi:hypothetical protein